MSTSPVYDMIGRGYVAHRRADPRWEAVIHEHLGEARLVVNVGAGTGSYEPPHLPVVAIEPSNVMVAQRPPSAAPVVRASASALPLPSGGADVAMAILTVHHWDDWEAGLDELCRVAPRRLVLGIDFDRHGSFWLLEDYLPEVAATTRAIAPGADAIAAAIGATSVVPLLVPIDMEDGVLGAYWRRPEAYLEAGVRATCSGLALADPTVIERGVRALDADLERGTWYERHADLLDHETLDLGYRLLISE
jgi:SAM-dependent methyltransferase